MRSPSSFALGLALLLAGCGASSEELRQTQADVARLDAQIAELREQVVAARRVQYVVTGIETRLKHVEERVGVAHFEPTGLTKPPIVAHLSPGSATLVAHSNDGGTRKNLAKHLAGYRGYVVSFWATWCKPCTSPEELTHLAELRRQLARWQFDLVSVAVDDLGKVLRDPRAPNWVYPLWHRVDAHLDMLPRPLIERIGVGLPLFLIVDAGGEILWYRAKQLDEDAVREITTAAATAAMVRPR